MILEYLLLAFTISLVIIILRKRKSHPHDLKIVPIARGGLPIFGHLFKVTSRLYEYLNKLKDIYGPVFSIQIGMKNFIILSSYDTINKTLKNQGHNFSGRWRDVFAKVLFRNSGIVFTEKEWWMEQRVFTLKVLKDFGFGKRSTEDIVRRESEKLINSIKSLNGKETDSNNLVSMLTVNVISDFIMKKEFNDTDKEAVYLVNLMKTVLQANESNSLIWILFPIFSWFPNITMRLMRIFDSSKITESLDKMIAFIKIFIEEHKKRFTPENECHDLIDAFLLETHKKQACKVENHTFTEIQLNILILELFIAGYETTSSTLSWSFLLLAVFPEIQSKMRIEISREIGLFRSPIMVDKKSLHFCQAVMDEIYRWSTVIPLSIPRRCFEDASVNGYFIPADSIIFPNLFACHRDPMIWEKPHNFYPEHFLDNDGKYQSRPELIPFGIGRRQCLGEPLARMEEFIVVISVLQKFYIHLGKDYVNIEISRILAGTNGTFRGTIPHKLSFQEISTE